MYRIRFRLENGMEKRAREEELGGNQELEFGTPGALDINPFRNRAGVVWRFETGLYLRDSG